VIDASIARAAGRTEHPTSRNARQALLAILEHGHAFGAASPLREEWKRHASQFARTWLTSMHARRRVHSLDRPPLGSLRQKLREAIPDVGDDREALDKDCHLVEAAVAFDRLILSLDERARALFHAAALRVGELRSIGWVNTNQKTPDPVPWLEAGAPPHLTRKLGQPEDPLPPGES
jgi:hypothetical protein